MKWPATLWGESPEAYAGRVREHAETLAALQAPFDEMARDRFVAGSPGVPVPVPSANRGLKGAEANESPAGAIIDFCTFTFPAGKALQGAICTDTAASVIRARADEGDTDSQRCIAEWLADAIAPRLVVDRERRGFRNFYENHFRLLTPDGATCGYVAMGGQRQRGTICVELTGAACGHVTAWPEVRRLMESINARISRVDVAHDDYDGTNGIEQAVRWYEAGEFNANGRPPSMQRVGWNDGSGRTVYIGKNKGNQQLCVYEKGREQGARDGDPRVDWVRWEARFGAKYRVIPLEILTDPVPYLVGHYPVIGRWIESAMTRMRTSIARAEANLAGAIRHLRRQGGAVINAIRKCIQSDAEFGIFIQTHITRDRLPAWLRSLPSSADALRHAIRHAREGLKPEGPIPA